MVDLYLQITVRNFGGEIIRNAEIKRFKRPFDLYKPSIPFRVEPKEGLIIEIGSYSQLKMAKVKINKNIKKIMEN